MVDELIAQGCTERKNQIGIPYFENEAGGIVAKVCRKCSEVRSIEVFGKDRRNTDGHRAYCKGCQSEGNRKYRSSNPEKKLKNSREWRENNPVRVREYGREWSSANRDKVTLRVHRRRARKSALPDTLTISQWQGAVSNFNGGCALTGSTEYDREHAMPLAIGHGGTTLENMYPLRADLNYSKQASHIFEWFDSVKERFGLSQHKFDELIAYLAEVNDMTPKEYRAYTDWCFDNPVKIEVE